MSEEKKDDLQEQQDFLSGHEELLNAINKKPEEEGVDAEPVEETAEEFEEAVEPVEETAEEFEEAVEPVSAEPAPAAEEEPAPAEEPVAAEEQIEEAPVAESPVEEAKDEQPVIEEASVEEEPVAEEKPAPVAEPAAVKPVVDEKPEPVQAAPQAAQKPAASKKKKQQHRKDKTVRNEAEQKRHEELLKQKELEDAEVKEVLGFFQKYAKPVGLFILICCVLFMGDRMFKNMRANKEAAADEALSNAKTEQDYQDIVDTYGKTSYGPLALMGLAQEKFNANKPDEAEKLYGQFIEKYPKHEMIVQAEFNQITCKEAKGELSEASILYGDFNKKHESSHLAPVALLGKARCYEALDNYSEAKLVYEDIITFYPESGWSQIAESLLTVAESKLK